MPNFTTPTPRERQPLTVPSLGGVPPKPPPAATTPGRGHALRGHRRRLAAGKEWGTPPHPKGGEASERPRESLARRNASPPPPPPKASSVAATTARTIQDDTTRQARAPAHARKPDDASAEAHDRHLTSAKHSHGQPHTAHANVRDNPTPQNGEHPAAPLDDATRPHLATSPQSAHA